MITLVILWPITLSMSLVSPGAQPCLSWTEQGWYLYFWRHKLLLTWELQMDINQILKLLVKLSSRVSNKKWARQVWVQKCQAPFSIEFEKLSAGGWQWNEFKVNIYSLISFSLIMRQLLLTIHAFGLFFYPILAINFKTLLIVGLLNDQFQIHKQIFNGHNKNTMYIHSIWSNCKIQV